MIYVIQFISFFKIMKSINSILAIVSWHSEKRSGKLGEGKFFSTLTDYRIETTSWIFRLPITCMKSYWLFCLDYYAVRITRVDQVDSEALYLDAFIKLILSYT